MRVRLRGERFWGQKRTELLCTFRITHPVLAYCRRSRRKGEPFQQGKAQKGSAQRAAGARAAPLSDRTWNKTGGKNDLKIKGTLKPMFPGAYVCAFLSMRRAFGGISRVKEPHSSSPYNCADSEPGQTSLIFLAATKKSGRRVERSQPGQAERQKRKAWKKTSYLWLSIIRSTTEICLDGFKGKVIRCVTLHLSSSSTQS